MRSSFFKLTFGILLVLFSMRSFSQNWPQWRGSNRDGKVTGFSAPQTWPQQLKQSWKMPVGFGDATPALVNNRLYVFTRQGDKELLLCLDAATGKQIWASEGYSTPAPTGPPASHPGPRSSPAVAEGKVVTFGVNGIFSCFDASTGKLIWRNSEFTDKPTFFTAMSPVISEGVCVAHFGGDKTGQYVAFNLANGSIKWETDGDGIAYASPSLMTVDGTKMVVFQGTTKLVGVGFADGKVLWEVPTPLGAGRAYACSSPIIDGQKVYYTGLNNGVNAIEIRKQGSSFVANKLWTNPDFSTTYNTPVLKDGFLYGLSNQNKLFCINATNGQTAWVDAAAHQNFGSIIDAGSVIVALSSTSNLVVYRPSGTGYSQLALIKVADTPVYAHPILSGNRIFVKDNESLILYTTN